MSKCAREIFLQVLWGMQVTWSPVYSHETFFFLLRNLNQKGLWANSEEPKRFVGQLRGLMQAHAIIQPTLLLV